MKPEHRFLILRKCPECKDKIVVWDIADPYFLSIQDSEKIFKDIKGKVEELIEKL
jgi:protein-tyrosine-phosphatase